jgi:hypothetical protein
MAAKLIRRLNSKISMQAAWESKLLVHLAKLLKIDCRLFDNTLKNIQQLFVADLCWCISHVLNQLENNGVPASDRCWYRLCR